MKSLLELKLAIAIIACALFMEGCSMEDPVPAPSDNLSALRDIVNLQIPANSGRWEIFGTPEYKGGVPGPTDYTTLVAELESSQSHWLENLKEPAGVNYVVPEAGRLWLREPFRQLLLKNKNSNADLSQLSNCRKYQTSLRKTGKPVGGFICEDASHLLIYLLLSAPQ
ncbi:hypothetical protein [Duganella callida]|uniref:Uncharacterized protein n=1 Tax=Duganella callida TaxID=2561932 RepID=A0A4Y9S9S6_9BURK|nr:hypothetical protein [Duganella callida]TFW18573.1 hypothetical protein E4L98_18025 [Duganella callida]